MFQRHLIRRTLQLGACGAAILLSATPGTTAPEKATKADKRACKEAYKGAQEREQANHLREARELLLTCSKATCSAFLKQECSAKYTQLNADIPTVVPIVTDDAGALRVDVQVKMDGEMLTSQLDGHALAVDPGLHEFSFSTGGSIFATQKILIVQGQRNRTISVSTQPSKKTLAASVLPAPPVETVAEPSRAASEKPAPRRLVTSKSTPHEAEPETTAPPRDMERAGVSALTYVLGGVGVAAVGTGALLLVWGNKDNDGLAQCSPSCQPASVDRVRTLYTAADISFGVGVASLGVATYLFATRPLQEKPATHAAYHFDVQPTPSGAFATVSGQF
jgi:hypothetical protein